MSHSEDSQTAAGLSDKAESLSKEPQGTDVPQGSAVSVGARMDSPTIITSPKYAASARMQPAQPPEIISRLRGECLEHFELDDLVGSGGMAAVFLARDTRLDRQVALKVLPQTPETDPELIQRFKNEARAAARLDHENIARVYYVGEDRGVAFIAFEFVDGTNLRDLIEQSGRLPLAEAINYCLQITGALVHAASRDVVHRDIKPSNIIITSNGRAKLVDMGLARRFETTSDAGVTQSGVTLGTFDYISPEQARDPRTADARSDIYSLGCTLYHMLTGQPPFSEGTIAQKLLAHQAEEPPSPQERNPQIPDDLAAIVAKMMAKQPRRRYRDPEQLYRDLLLVAGALGLRSTSPEGLIWMSPTKPHIPAWERHAPLAIPLATLLAVAAVLFVWQRSAMEAADVDRSFPFASSSVSKNDRLTAENDLKPARPDQTSNRSQTPTGPQRNPGVRVDQAVEAADAAGPRASGAELEPTRATADRIETNDSTDASDRISFSPSPKSTRPSPSGRIDEQGRSVHVMGDSAGDQPTTVAERPGGSGFAPKVKGFGVRADRTRVGASPDPEISLETDREIEPRQNRSSVTEAVEKPGDTAPYPSDRERETTFEKDLPLPSNRQSTPRGSETVASEKHASAAVRPNTLVVDPFSSGERVYRTIGAALEGAPRDSASIIELRYNGPQQEEPFKINGIRVTIRPAEGFEPVVVMVPKEIPTQGFRTRMISISGGSLSLMNVPLELRLPKGGDPWSLIYLQSPEKLSVEGCAITVRNPDGQSAALVEVVSSSVNPVELKFRDCFLRVDADVILARHPQPIRIDISNSVVAASGRLLRVLGSAQPRPSEHIELELDHVSARTDGGLLLLEATEAEPNLIPVRMTTSNNILQTQNFVPDASPLIKVVGPRDVESLGELIEEDLSIGYNNFYEGYEIFREIHSSTGSTFMMNTTGRSTWNFDAWQTFRGSQESEPRLNQVKWRIPLPQGPPTEMGLSEWQLADEPNPARDGTSDGADAGARLDDVPSPRAAMTD